MKQVLSFLVVFTLLDRVYLQLLADVSVGKVFFFSALFSFVEL